MAGPATSGSSGTVLLSGDLAGSKDAYNPVLSPTGVVAGSYVAVTLVTDAKGRIIHSRDGTGEELAFQQNPATVSNQGLVRISSNIDVDGDGIISMPIASSTILGLVQVGGSSIQSSNTGVISVVDTRLDPASDGSLGIVEAGTDIDIASGVISVNASSLTPNLTYGTDSTKGTVQAGTDIDAAAGVISVNASSLTPSLTYGTGSAKGTVQAGTDIDIASGVIGVNASSLTPSLTYGTGSAKGIVQTGTHIDASSGVIEVNPTALTQSLAWATSSNLGIAQAGADIDIASGVISVNASSLSPNLTDATASVKGIVQPGDGLTISSGSISFDVATSTLLGGVKPGSAIQVTAGGTLEIAPLDITKSSLGFFDAGVGFAVNNDTLEASEASQSITGLVIAGRGIDFDGSGISLATSSSSSFGGIIIGSGLSVNNGTVSLDTGISSSSVAAQIQIGSNIQVSNGDISIDIATNSTPGVVKSGAITASNGFIKAVPSQAAATASSLGLVQLGNGFTWTSSGIEIVKTDIVAASGLLGVVATQQANASYMAITNGTIHLKNTNYLDEPLNLTLTTDPNLDLIAGVVSGVNLVKLDQTSVRTKTAIEPPVLVVKADLKGDTEIQFLDISTGTLIGWDLLVFRVQGETVNSDTRYEIIAIDLVAETYTVDGYVLKPAYSSCGTCHYAYVMNGAFVQSNPWYEQTVDHIYSNVGYEIDSNISQNIYIDLNQWDHPAFELRNPTIPVALVFGARYTVIFKQHNSNPVTLSYGSRFKISGSGALSSRANSYNKFTFIYYGGASYIGWMEADF